jgi:hypothetical protein
LPVIIAGSAEICLVAREVTGEFNGDFVDDEDPNDANYARK